MSDRKQLTPHPAEDQLLRLSDGELSAREATATRDHLELCWQCRSRLDEMQAGIADYMRYEERVLKTLLPSPPRPWTDLTHRMRESDAAAVTFRKSVASWRPPTWFAVAAAVLLAILAIWRLERVPAVSAAELLQKAAASEASRPVTRGRIRVRTKRRNYTRSASLRKPAVAVSQADSQENAEIRKLFEEARFNWDDPLSAESYRLWHDQLSEKRDDVSRTGTDYVIHTRTTSSVLTDATLTIRDRDMRGVQERFQFQLGEWVEISEVMDEGNAPPVETPNAGAAPATDPARKQEAPVAPEQAVAGPAEELQVAVALHRIAADLGEPIEVTREGPSLVVAAMGLGAARQRQVRSAVAAIRGVEVRFDQPELMRPAPRSSSPPSAAQRRNSSGTLSALQLRIQNQLGDQSSVEEFTNRVLDANEAAMARAYALRALARRFTPETEAQLSPADRNVLAGLRRDYLNALRARVREIDGLLEPELADLAPGAKTPAAGLSPEWQTQVQQVFTSMQRVDRLLTAMLAGSSSGPSEPGPGELAASLRVLEGQLPASR